MNTLDQADARLQAAADRLLDQIRAVAKTKPDTAASINDELREQLIQMKENLR